jgi:hypothetical protein
MMHGGFNVMTLRRIMTTQTHTQTDSYSQTEPWIKRNLFALLATALQLTAWGVYIGRQEAIISAQERRLAVVEEKMQFHHEDINMHTTAEWRTNMLATVNRIEGKVDAHILGDRK